MTDQLLKKKRLGVDVFMRGMSAGIRSSNKSQYYVTLYELIKSYSNHVMKKNFLSINIPKLPVCSTEQGIEIIKKNMSKLIEWRNFAELVPKNFKKNIVLKKTGLAGIFSASLELTKEGIKVMPEVMIPLVGTSTEFDHQENLVREVASSVINETGTSFKYLVSVNVQVRP